MRQIRNLHFDILTLGAILALAGVIYLCSLPQTLQLLLPSGSVLRQLWALLSAVAG